MFGAYQAGVCDILMREFRPDLFAGASIGALNSWALAGGCGTSDLLDLWLKAGPGAMQRSIRELHGRFRPKTDVGVVVTEWRRLRPLLFRNEEITWRHLLGSCAVLGLLPQQRLNGRYCSDGGLLGALPLWAAAEMGATRIVAVNALTRMPGVIRAAVSVVRAVSRWTPPPLTGVQTLMLTPGGLLGSAIDSLYWKRENVERWIDQGRRDAEANRDRVREFLRRPPDFS
jgi:predicted acylesterase/phospholipase RssA